MPGLCKTHITKKKSEYNVTLECHQIYFSQLIYEFETMKSNTITECFYHSMKLHSPQTPLENHEYNKWYDMIW